MFEVVNGFILLSTIIKHALSVCAKAAIGGGYVTVCFFNEEITIYR